MNSPKKTNGSKEEPPNIVFMQKS